MNMSGGGGRRRPVLIIPGFMSSGLAVRRSPHKSWEGGRLWLNITSAGFHSLHVGGALRRNERRRSAMNLGAEPADPSSEDMHQEYLRQMECKSRWLWHIRLGSDMIHEREGVEVRPVPGTAGVDYLAPGALTESASYVFGPVLKVLKAKGYVEGVDLAAAPYDWRIPPSELESRDRYFSATMEEIQRLYEKSGNRPVVLLCHSMGCKTGHYLLNFALYRLGQADGRAWIDRHIHSYVPVGAPHIGAQKAIRGVIDGDKMGLEAFLDDDEGLVLGRSLGSCPWMFPIESIDGPAPETAPQSPPIPTVVVRNESTLRVTLPAQFLRLDSFVHNRKKCPPDKLRMAIQVGNDVTVRTDFVDVARGGQGRPLSSLYVNFKEDSWVVACPPDFKQALRHFPYIQLHLEEPGTGKAPKQRRGIYHLDILWPFRCAWCLIKWVLCCPCALVSKLGRFLVKGAKKGADMGAALLGEIRVIGQSGRVDWKKGLIKSNSDANAYGGEGGGTGMYQRWTDGGEGGRAAMYQIWTQIKNTEDVRYGFFLQKPTPEDFTIKVKWEPSTFSSAVSANVCHHCHRHAVDRITYAKQKDISYNDLSNGKELVRMEGLMTATRLLEETYGNDPLGPLSLSAWRAPPVKKVTAIYGINLPTEVGGVYKRNPSIRTSASDTHLSLGQLFVLDEEAALNERGGSTHVIGGGVIRETKDTPQKIVGGGVERKSGDGTVPYWSLQHCRAWEGECDLTVHEIEAAEHRAILNDKRFHGILLDLLGC